MKLIFRILSILSLGASVMFSILLILAVLDSTKHPDSGWGIGPLLILFLAFLILPFIFFKQRRARTFIILFALVVVGGTYSYIGTIQGRNEKQRQGEIANFKQNNGEYNLPKNWVLESSRLDSGGLHKTYKFGDQSIGLSQSTTSFSASVDDLGPSMRIGAVRLITREDVTIGADNGIYFVKRTVDPGVNVPNEKFQQLIMWGNEQTTLTLGVVEVKEKMLTQEELISIAKSVKKE